MQDSTFAIQLLLLGSAVPVGLEAYKASKPKGFYTLWAITAVMVLGGICFPAIARLWPVAGTAFANLATSPTTWFAFAIGLFFVARPYWQKGTVPADAPPGGADISLIRDDSKIHAEIQGLSEKLESVRVDGQIAIRDLQKLDQKLSKISTQTLESFYAIASKETLVRLETDINAVVGDMYDRLRDGGSYDSASWQSWESCHAHWSSLLDRWIDNAQWYAPDVRTRVTTVEEREYAAKWNVKDDQFPSSDAVRQFKRFRIIHSHYDDVKAEVMSGVWQVAYAAQSTKDLMHGNPQRPL